MVAFITIGSDYKRPSRLLIPTSTEIIQLKPQILQQWENHYLSSQLIFTTSAKLMAKSLGLFVFTKYFFPHSELRFL